MTTSDVTGPSAPPREAQPPATPDLATPLNLWAITACAVVATVGLSGDIARHLQDGTSITGDFLASWHLVLYAGVTGIALWLGKVALAHGPVAMRRSFGPTAAGVFVLGAGGVGDWIWHSTFGVEVDIAALVSPPHLLLLVGLVLVLLGPVACIWRAGEPALSLSAAAVVGICTTCVIVVISLFTGYLSLFAADVVVNGYANPMVGTRISSTEVIHGIATMLWTTLVLTLPWVVQRMRWPHQPGLVALSFLVLGGASAASVPGVAGEVVSSTIVAGVVIDMVLTLATRRLHPDRAMLATAVLVPLVLWSLVFLSLDSSNRLEWNATLWVGSTALSVLAVTTVTGLLVLARRMPPAA